ncbi:hypothetical protein QNE77_004436 [Vibrio alginolyticus]|nr:hypothetical protein [Vibrio alginolyticus]ELB2929752.1 hypothetical protein [Vibrio alginolyticus]
METQIKAIIQKAEDTYQTARFGYDDLVSTSRLRRFSGLRNLIVFGRSVTFVLQNLKTPVGEEAFNEWYIPLQEEMKQDVVMKYFVTLRNEILKQGKLPISTSVTATISSGDIAKLGNPPPGAQSFFIGDQSGGSGWVIELADGTEEKYYVEIPESMAKVQQHFSELPVPEEDSLKTKSIEELCRYYLEKLENLIDDAKLTFLNDQTQKVGSVRLPSYLRVVK